MDKMGDWDIFEHTPYINVLESTWAFKIKRFPSGIINKFKNIFFDWGDKQFEGVYYFETYAPLVQWTTVISMLVLEIILDLKSKQGDVTSAFLNSGVPEGENVYVAIPRGFRSKGKLLKLQNNLYILRKSPRAFRKYVMEKLEKCKLKQSEFDTCLFLGEKVICIFTSMTSYFGQMMRQI